MTLQEKTRYNLTGFLHLTLFIGQISGHFHHAISRSSQKRHHLWGHVVDVVTVLMITLLHKSSEIRRIGDEGSW